MFQTPNTNASILDGVTPELEDSSPAMTHFYKGDESLLHPHRASTNLAKPVSDQWAMLREISFA